MGPERKPNEYVPGDRVLVRCHDYGVGFTVIPPGALLSSNEEDISVYEIQIIRRLGASNGRNIGPIIPDQVRQAWTHWDLPAQAYAGVYTTSAASNNLTQGNGTPIGNMVVDDLEEIDEF